MFILYLWCWPCVQAEQNISQHPYPWEDAEPDLSRIQNCSGWDKSKSLKSQQRENSSILHPLEILTMVRRASMSVSRYGTWGVSLLKQDFAAVLSQVTTIIGVIKFSAHHTFLTFQQRASSFKPCLSRASLTVLKLTVNALQPISLFYMRYIKGHFMEQEKTWSVFLISDSSLFGCNEVVKMKQFWLSSFFN